MTAMTPEQLADRLTAASKRVGPAIARRVRHEATLLTALIQAHAMGRPGPNAPTGDYLGSWEPHPYPVPHGGGAIVATDRPQGRRLEWGFVGADSLGRVYNQPPYPHVQPAIDIFQPKFPAAIRDAAVEVFR